MSKIKGFKIPPTIYSRPYGHIFANLWYRMHVKKKMCFMVFLGDPGVGKTVLATEFAMLLDRPEKRDVSRFTPDNFTLGPLQLMQKINEKHPKGTFFVNDDAGLTAGARDALSLINKTMSKVLKT